MINAIAPASLTDYEFYGPGQRNRVVGDPLQKLKSKKAAAAFFS